MCGRLEAERCQTVAKPAKLKMSDRASAVSFRGEWIRISPLRGRGRPGSLHCKRQSEIRSPKSERHQSGQRPSARKASCRRHHAGNSYQYNRWAPGQGRPVRVSPSHQLPNSASMPDSGAVRRSNSSCSARTTPGRGCATMVNSAGSCSVVARRASRRSNCIDSRKSGWSISPISFTTGGWGRVEDEPPVESSWGLADARPQPPVLFFEVAMTSSTIRVSWLRVLESVREAWSHLVPRAWLPKNRSR